MSDTTADLPPLFAASGDVTLAAKPVVWSNKARLLAGPHRWLKGALYTYVVAELLLGALNGALIWVLGAIENGAVFEEWQLTIFDVLLRYGNLIGVGLMLIGYLLAAVMFCRFVYRAMKNLDLSNARGEGMSPGWAVAYNFIPLMNIWKPFQAMAQIWRGSLDPDRNRIERPSIMGWWWGLWLITNWVSNVSFRMAVSSGAFADQITDFEAYKLTLWLDAFTSLTGIASVFFLLPIVRQITSAQDERTSAAKT